MVSKCGYYAEKIGYYLDRWESCRSGRLLLVLVLTGLFLMRIPHLVANPQFWAEDGSIFFREARCLGSGSLFSTYQGYYHLIPRLAALLATRFDMAHAPAIYFATAIFFTALVVYLVSSPRLKLPYKPLLAFWIVLIPNGFEVQGNVTNTQWYVAIGLLVLLLMAPPVGRVLLFLEGLLFFVFALTGPFVLLLLPAVALQLWIHRSDRQARRRTALLAVIALVAAGIQAQALLHHPTAAAPAGLVGLPYLKHLATLMPLASLLHLATPYLLVACKACRLDSLSVPALIGSSLAAIGIFAVLCLDFVRGNLKTHKSIMAYYGLSILLAAYYKNRYDLKEMIGYYNCGRYFFIPGIMLSWLLVLSLKEKSTRYGAVFFLSLLLATAVSEFRRPPLDDLHWALWSAKAAQVPVGSIPINPPGWSINMHCKN